MPDLFMDVDTGVTVPVNILPLVDDTDFKTIEPDIAYDAAGMALTWHFVTTAGVITATAVTPTTGGNYDWAEDLANKGTYKIEIPASGGASINNDTEGVGWFTGVCTGVLPWRGPTVCFRAAALNNSLIDGTTVDVNVTAMANGTVTAAAIATGAIDADAIADDAIDAGALATGALTADAFAADAIVAATLATGAITADAFAADAIVAATLATDSISADAIKADAVTEIQSGLALEATLTAIKGATWSATTDTLEDIADNLAVAVPSVGEVEWPYTVSVNGVVQAGALVKLYGDAAYTDFWQQGNSAADGIVTFHLTIAQNAATKYLKIYAPGIAVAYDTEVP